MKRLLSRVCLISYALCSSPSVGFFIINDSDSPKNIEVIAYAPSTDGVNKTPQVVLKKELQPDDIIEAPFSLSEVTLDVHWGKPKTISSVENNWKPIEMKTENAAQWQAINTARCGKDKRLCHVVIPPTWRFEEDNFDMRVTTDNGTIIHAASPAELMVKIPYRRIVETAIQEKILTTDPQAWKKIGTNHRKNEDIVIPLTWTILEEKNQYLITTDTGKKLSIPINHETSIGDTGKKQVYTLANEDVIKKIIPYRRKGNIISELRPSQRIFVIEQATQKPIQTTQYNLFRRFAARDAEPAPQVRGVPERIGPDHIFEIFGSEYDTDIALMYTPYEKKPTETHTKRVHSPELNTESKKTKTEKTKQSFRKTFLQKRKTAPASTTPEQENVTNL